MTDVTTTDELQSPGPDAQPAGPGRRRALALGACFVGASAMAVYGPSASALEPVGSPQAAPTGVTEPASGTTAILHTAPRLDITLDMSFDQAVSRYEAALPLYDGPKMLEVARASGLEAVKEYIAEISPYRFFIFYKLNVSMFMGAVGHPERCVTYLMGNPAVAETMYRHDPGVMLYAPLRIVIHEDQGGTVHFLIDQPSALFRSFRNAEIAKTGRYLDRAVAGLLRGIGFPVPRELARA